MSLFPAERVVLLDCGKKVLQIIEQEYEILEQSAVIIKDFDPKDPVDGKGFINFFKKYGSKIMSISFEGPCDAITEIALSAILLHCVQLKALRVKPCRFSIGMTEKKLKILTNMYFLQALAIQNDYEWKGKSEGCPLTDELLTRFAINNVGLEQVFLSNCSQITDLSVQAVADYSSVCELRIIDCPKVTLEKMQEFTELYVEYKIQLPGKKLVYKTS